MKRCDSCARRFAICLIRECRSCPTASACRSCSSRSTKRPRTDRARRRPRASGRSAEHSGGQQRRRAGYRGVRPDRASRARAGNHRQTGGRLAARSILSDGRRDVRRTCRPRWVRAFADERNAPSGKFVAPVRTRSTNHLAQSCCRAVNLALRSAKHTAAGVCLRMHVHFPPSCLMASRNPPRARGYFTSTPDPQKISASRSKVSSPEARLIPV